MKQRQMYFHILNHPTKNTPQTEYSSLSKIGKLGSYHNQEKETLEILKRYPR